MLFDLIINGSIISHISNFSNKLKEIIFRDNNDICHEPVMFYLNFQLICRGTELRSHIVLMIWNYTHNKADIFLSVEKRNDARNCRCRWFWDCRFPLLLNSHEHVSQSHKSTWMFKESFFFCIAPDVREVDSSDVNDAVPFDDILDLLHHDCRHALKLFDSLLNHVLTSVK